CRHIDSELEPCHPISPRPAFVRRHTSRSFQNWGGIRFPESSFQQTSIRIIGVALYPSRAVRVSRSVFQNPAIGRVLRCGSCERLLAVGTRKGLLFEHCLNRTSKPGFVAVRHESTCLG